MDFFNILWLFFIVSAIQPIIRQKLLEGSRQRLIAKIERQRGSRVILMIHRQETMSLLGFPLVRYIDVHDSEELLRAIDLTDPDVPIDLVLHTPGGLVLAALQIARAIRAHRGKVTVFVPHYAMSGGTLIALGSDEIVMSPAAVLGPVDPQIGDCPAASVLTVLTKKPLAEIDDRTLVLADQAEKAIKQLRAAVRELLADVCSDDKAQELAELLATGHWTHDYGITASEAAAFGLPVTTAMPHEFMELMALYRQPTRRAPSVEYLPEPRRTQPHGPRGSQR